MVDVRLLDELAANATTAGAQHVVDGWRLRAAPDLPFSRANTVVPFAGPAPALGVTARIEVVERFYRDRGLPVRFLLSPAADPADLDARLSARGYTIATPVDIYVATADRVLAESVGANSPAARVVDAIDVDWIIAFTENRTRLLGYADLLAAIEPPSVAAIVDLNGAPAAIGFGVLERGWVGIFGMATRSVMRRRGAARAALRALARWASDAHATDLYLQVETDNEPARALYESAGFVRNHGYHYRVLA
jgi:GNAT superfamily N-acetyltransferase